MGRRGGGGWPEIWLGSVQVTGLAAGSDREYEKKRGVQDDSKGSGLGSSRGAAAYLSERDSGSLRMLPVLPVTSVVAI